MALKFLSSASNAIQSAWNNLTSALSRGPNVAAGEKYEQLNKNLKDEAADFPIDNNTKDALSNFSKNMKNDINKALSEFESKKVNKDELAKEMEYIVEYYTARLDEIHEAHFDTLKNDKEKESAKKWYAQQQQALSKYFEVLDSDIHDYINKLGAKKTSTPTEAHQEAEANKPKTAEIKGEEKNPSKKEPKMDLSGYSVPVHYKNGTFTFYNVKSATEADVKKAVDELAKQVDSKGNRRYTSIKISGKFSNDRKRDMWLHAQCKQPPMKVEGYAPTPGDFKVRDDARIELGLPPVVAKPKANPTNTKPADPAAPTTPAKP